MKQASYRKKVFKAGRTIDVEYTYPTQFGDNLTRKNASGKGTPLDVMNNNRELAIRKLTRIINCNFSPGDIWLTLTYERSNRPQDIDTADKHIKKYISLLKKEFKKRDLDFKWIKPKTAVGERGGVHHHLLIPQGLPISLINAIWKNIVRAGPKARPPDHTILYDNAEYSSLAAYIFDHYDKNSGTPKGKFDHTENNLPPDPNERNIKRWSGSRNLKKPIEEPPVIVHDIKWQEPPKARAGYYIDTDSIRAGCNPVTGRPYLFYRMIKPPPGFICYDSSGKQLTGKEAVKYYRQNNRNELKAHWIDLAPEGEVIFKKEVRQNA